MIERKLFLCFSMSLFCCLVIVVYLCNRADCIYSLMWHGPLLSSFFQCPLQAWWDRPPDFLSAWQPACIFPAFHHGSHDTSLNNWQRCGWMMSQSTSEGSDAAGPGSVRWEMGTVVEKGGKEKRRRRASLSETGVPLSHTQMINKDVWFEHNLQYLAFFIPTNKGTKATRNCS